MARNRIPRISDERLDAATRAVVRSAARTGAEADETANAPFLYARVRARIEERRREAESSASWLTLLQVARRAADLAFWPRCAALLSGRGLRRAGGRPAAGGAFASSATRCLGSTPASSRPCADNDQL